MNILKDFRKELKLCKSRKEVAFTWAILLLLLVICACAVWFTFFAIDIIVDVIFIKLGHWFGLKFSEFDLRYTDMAVVSLIWIHLSKKLK